MSYQLNDINFRTVSDPKTFIEECDALYREKVSKAADRIIENMERSPIVLLSGPSGSGKTTTAMKIAEELSRRGIGTYSVGMDDYFRTVDPETVPKYEFSRRMRILEPSKSIKLKPNEIVVFEGIHALNDSITDVHPEAFKLYISARSDVEFEGKVVFKRTWFRLMRRMVRDSNFRGTDALETMKMWANVRRGEKLYISPFKDKADLQFDTSFAYEPAVFNRTATRLLQSVPEGIERFEELRAVLPAIQLFGEIDYDLVAPDALIREFIGGGIYEY